MGRRRSHGPPSGSSPASVGAQLGNQKTLSKEVASLQGVIPLRVILIWVTSISHLTSAVVTNWFPWPLLPPNNNQTVKNQKQVDKKTKQNNVTPLYQSPPRLLPACVLKSELFTGAYRLCRSTPAPFPDIFSYHSLPSSSTNPVLGPSQCFSLLQELPCLNFTVSIL